MAGDEAVPAERALATRVFLGGALMVAAVLAVVLLVTSIGARRAAVAAAQRTLEQSADLTAQLLAGRGRSLAGGARVFVQGPYFRTLVAERRRDDILDQTFEAAAQLDAAWVFITDANGVLVAKSDEPSAHGDTLAGVALIAGALRGQLTSGFGGSGDSVLFLATGVPIEAPGGAAFGVLVATTRLDSLIAADIAAATGGAVVFFVRDRSGVAHLTASTLPLDDVVRARLVAHLGVRTAVGSADTTLLIDGAPWLAFASPLHTAAGDEVGGYVVLRRASALAPGANALRQSLVLAGGLGLLLAIVAAWLAARTIARPVASLTRAVQAVAEGEPTARPFRIVAPTPLLGELGSALDQWLGAQRDRERLTRLAHEVASSAPAVAGTRAVRVARSAAPRWSTPHVVRRTPVTAIGLPDAGHVGTVLAGRYEIEALVGRGGLGVVYRAFDRLVGERVAIKVFDAHRFPAMAPVAHLVAEELRLARKVTHEHVVRLHDVGTADGLWYLTMELVEGPALDEVLLRHGALDVETTLAIARQLLRALAAAHGEDVVHGDLKPHNLLIAEVGALKVTDFGLARLRRSDRRVDTAAHDDPAVAGRVVGGAVGTPRYMAPELLLGEGPTVASDLYAVGIVLQECLTGVVQGERETPVGLLGRSLVEAVEPGVAPMLPLAPESGTPPPPTDDVRRSRLLAVIGAMTQPHPERRPRAATEALAALRDAERAGAHGPRE